MEEIFIAVPTSVTLRDIRDVLERIWELDPDMEQPHIRLDLHRRAYVAELDAEDLDAFDMFSEGERELVQERVGDFRMLSLRWRSRDLAKHMARVIASSKLAEDPMLISPDGPYLTPEEFLASKEWGGAGR